MIRQNNTRFTKDPDAVLDYGHRFGDWLAEDETIESATWTVSTIADDPRPLTKDSSSHTADVATIWLSGGTVGSTYTATCHIVTDQGREDDRSLTFFISQR